jgi:hypothetical protein
MVNDEIRALSSEVFKIHPQIVHLGLIDLEGHVLLDQSAGSSEPNQPDKDRMMFYYQVGLRRSRREHFDGVYGNTTYIHIMREKMQQLMIYLPMITIYMTLDHGVNTDEIAKISQQIHNIDNEILDKASKSLFYH